MMGVPEKPHQPLEFNFPKRGFGIKEMQRSFQPEWFRRLPFLHYDEAKCYDGASAITGFRQGVATQISDIKP